MNMLLGFQLIGLGLLVCGVPALLGYIFLKLSKIAKPQKAMSLSGILALLLVFAFLFTGNIVLAICVGAFAIFDTVIMN